MPRSSSRASMTAGEEVEVEDEAMRSYEERREWVVERFCSTSLGRVRLVDEKMTEGSTV